MNLNPMYPSLMDFGSLFFGASLFFIIAIIITVIICVQSLAKECEQNKAREKFVKLMALPYSLLWLVTCPIHGPVRKVWNFLKKTFQGEDIIFDGLVLDISEYGDQVFRLQQSNELNIFSDDNYVVLIKYCMIKIEDLTFSSDPVYVKIKKSLNEIRREGLNLTIFSKCRIKCRKWPKDKDYVFVREI